MIRKRQPVNDMKRHSKNDLSYVLKPNQKYHRLSYHDKYKTSIRKVRANLESSVAIYEIEELEQCRIEELKHFLCTSLRNKRESSEKAHVLKDMLKQTERRYTKSREKYFFGPKIRNVRTVSRGRPPKIDEYTPKSLVRPGKTSSKPDICKVIQPELKEDKMRKTLPLHTPKYPKRPLPKTINFHPSPRSRVVENTRKRSNMYHSNQFDRMIRTTKKNTVRVLNYNAKTRQMNSERERSLKNSFTTTAKKTTLNRETEAGVSILDSMLQVAPNEDDVHPGTPLYYEKEAQNAEFLIEVLKGAERYNYTGKRTRQTRPTTASGFSPTNSYYKWKANRRPRTATIKTPTRGGLGPQRAPLSIRTGRAVPFITSPADRSPPNPFKIASKIALSSALHGKVQWELGPYVDFSVCWNLSPIEVEAKYGHLKARKDVAACKAVLIEQYYAKRQAICKIQKFSRRWNWRKIWKGTIRTYMAVAKAAAIKIQRTWRMKHMGHMIKLFCAERKAAARVIQRWWISMLGAGMCIDHAQVKMERQRAATINFFNSRVQENGSFQREDFHDMVVQVFRQPSLSDDDLDNIMFDLVGETSGNISIESIFHFRRREG